MGSYTRCWLDDLLVCSIKNDVNLELISLFRVNDKIVRGLPITDFPIHLEEYREILIEDPSLKVIYYEAPMFVIRDRLDVLGYDLVTAQDAFREWITQERNQVLKIVDGWQGKTTEKIDLMQDRHNKTIDILSLLSPEAWVEGLKEIHRSRLKTNYFSYYDSPYKDTLIGYMLSHDLYGYPGNDVYVLLRLVIDACGSGNKLIYDLTDLVWSEEIDYDEDFVAVGVSASEYSLKAKTIVLTEGKTDAWILNESLGFFYPHLKDYFSFLDFESTGFGGGVGNLANVIKAFAGAGIENNVIALFDNDTAATSVCLGLENITFPANIAIHQLPELDFLKNYPTIGPSGLVDMNVNGIAASIELYLGEDVLRIDGKSLVPIQWTGFEKLTKKYQGEVLEKAKLQARFKEKLARAHNGEDVDWHGLRTVFHLIFTSFLDRNRRIICKRASEYYTT